MKLNIWTFSAKNGLTEAELEDIMSCDDDVLNDVYMYWEPPVRRLPPLLFVRLKADLSQYLGSYPFLIYQTDLSGPVDKSADS